MASVYSAKTYDFHDFDDDDDVSDDEVFANDKKGSIRMDEENGVNKPLMAPRRKVKTNKLHTEVRRGTKCRTTCVPLCYALVALGCLIGVICLVVFLINIFANKFNLQQVKLGFERHKDDPVGCTHFQVADVWTTTLPKLTTETAFRLVDVNGDGALDVLLGFGTGADGYNVPSVVCDVYFEGRKPCFGGILALDGRSGKELWRHYTDHEVFALNCNEDLNNDGVRDCVAGGRAGVLQAVSGKTGDLLWDFGPQEAKNDIMNVYTPQMIPDIDEDGVVDVLACHGGDPLADPGSAFRLSGRLMILSGKTGKVIQWVGVPDKRESYYSPQLLQHPDGSQMVLFGTGGETHAGGLWLITLNDLIKGSVHKSIPIYQDPQKGIMTPPVIVDVNGDGIEDIVMAMFNSTVVAFDGLRFHQIWNFTFPSSETYSTPAAGFFNDDDVPDFLVKYLRGPGFPIYYDAQTTVLDGRDGKPMLDKSIRDTIGTQASQLTVSMEGVGNDIFLYWSADCLGHEGKDEEFNFLKGTNVHEQSRADLCKLRFKSDLVTRLYAFNQHVEPSGFALYSSDTRKGLEYSNFLNTSAIAQQYLMTHPDVAHAYHIQSQHGKHLFHGNGNKNFPERTTYDGRLTPATHHNKAKHPVVPSPEYEEEIAYPESHSVRKHGHYKNWPEGLNAPVGSGRSPSSGYYDYNLMDDEMAPLQTQTQDVLGHPQWASNMDNAYVRNSDDLWDGGSPYESRPQYQSVAAADMPYGPQNEYSLFGMQDQYANSRRPYHREQGTGWNHNPNYDRGLEYRRRLTRSQKFPLQGNQQKRKNSKNSRIRTRRFRRHVGPHDMDGIQRIISTGTLAPVLDPTAPDANHSIDVIFATYWFFPSKTQAILPEDRDCIQHGMSQEENRFQTDSKYYGMDHDAYEEAITKECVNPLQHNKTYESQSDYDPFNIHMGQMTVYRLRLQCTCKGDVRIEVARRRCATVLPFDQQGWAAYMGTRGDGHFNYRQPSRN